VLQSLGAALAAAGGKGKVTIVLNTGDEIRLNVQK
jgi:hypothetical protein